MTPPAAPVEPSGIVVELSRPGPGRVAPAAGTTLLLSVAAFATAPLTSLELWAGDAKVAATPDPGASSDRAVFEWVAQPGTNVLLARATTAAGAAWSNPLAIEATDQPASIVAVLPSGQLPTADELAAAGIEPAAIEVLDDLDGTHTAVALPPPVPPATESPAPAAAEPGGDPRIVVDDCVARLADTARTDGLVVSRLGPGGTAFEVTAPAGGYGETLGPGTHYVLLQPTSGSDTARSEPIRVEVGEECGAAWEGDVALRSGLLEFSGAADLVYLYLSTDGSNWQRVPKNPQTFVPAAGGSADFTAHLPRVLGGEVHIEAWGWAGGGLVHLGDGHVQTPAPASEFIGLGGGVELQWLERPGAHGLPDVLSTAGTLDEAGAVDLRWTTDLPGLTHVLWQVTGMPVPHGNVLTAPVLASGWDDDGEFSVDLEPLTHVPRLGAATAAGPGYEQLVPIGPAGDVLTETPILPGTSTVTGLVTTTTTPPPGEIIGALLDEFTTDEFYVRVLPFAGEQYLGKPSNDVFLRIGLTAQEILDLYEPPEEEAPVRVYDLADLHVEPPQAPMLQYSACFEFVGWNVAAMDWAQFGWWYGYWGTYVTGYPWNPKPGVMICPDTGDDDGGWFSGVPILGELEQFVILGVGALDWASGAFADVKAWVVDKIVTFTGCKAAGGTVQKWCDAAATIAVDAALIYLGIPPSLPNSEDLAAIVKGDLSAGLVGLANDLGIPCDEIATADDLDDDVPTCEEIADELLDEVEAQATEMFRQAASSVGLYFPPGMQVKPSTAGQPVPAVVTATVVPRPGAPFDPPPQCQALITTQSEWWSLFGFTLPASHDFGPTYYLGAGQPVPVSGEPFEYRTVPLSADQPFAHSPLVPATRSWMVGSANWFLADIPVYSTSTSPYDDIVWTHPSTLPALSLLLHEGAQFTAAVFSSCAGYAEATVTVPPRSWP